MLTTAVCSRVRSPPQEQEHVFPAMAEHSFLRLGFKSDHYELSGICFRLPQTTVTFKLWSRTNSAEHKPVVVPGLGSSE